jgi:hypothetical protein
MKHCTLALVPFIAISKDEKEGVNLHYEGRTGSKPCPISGDEDTPAYANGLRRFNQQTDTYVLFYNTVGLEQGEDIERVNKLVMLSLAMNPLTQLQCLFRVNRFGKVVTDDTGNAPPIEVEMFPTPYNLHQFCQMTYLLNYYSEMVSQSTQLARNAEKMFGSIDNSPCKLP